MSSEIDGRPASFVTNPCPEAAVARLTVEGDCGVANLAGAAVARAHHYAFEHEADAQPITRLY